MTQPLQNFSYYYLCKKILSSILSKFWLKIFKWVRRKISGVEYLKSDLQALLL